MRVSNKNWEWAAKYDMWHVPKTSASVAACSPCRESCNGQVLQVKQTSLTEYDQTSLPVSLVGTATSIIFVMTNTWLLRQNTSFVATNICHGKHNLSWQTKVSSRQAYFCPDKTNFLSRQKLYLYVATHQWIAAGNLVPLTESYRLSTHKHGPSAEQTACSSSETPRH